MGMMIRYEDEQFALRDTERNHRFVEAFRDPETILHGQRFTVDVVLSDWTFRDIEIAFQPDTRIAVMGRTFGKEPERDLDEYFTDADQPRP